ncbi:MAG: hypothetical protein COA52_00645 [Hyphomicrobiales bacterium]|nr:MAG: hypothetical protein COA52_00645 [Hyphomicrobiales bacterium]
MSFDIDNFEHLPPRLCGYAPGVNMKTCPKCKKVTHGVDKHSYECLNCAIKTANEGIKELGNKNEEQHYEILKLKKKNKRMKKMLNFFYGPITCS